MLANLLKVVLGEMTHFRQTTGDDGAITVILKDVDEIV